MSIILWVVHPKAALVGGKPITFFLIHPIHTGTPIPDLTADHMKTYASDDPPAWFILLITVGAAVVAVVSLFLVPQSPEAPDPLQLALSLATVALGWFTIHTMTALHYAHLYWRPDDDPKTKDERHLAGSNFRQRPSPASTIFSISPS